MTKRINVRFLIFGAIGVFNTLFDLALYVVFYNFTHSVILANVVSTSAALIGSYFLNARLTFRSKRWTASRFLLFIVVTIFGLWVLQTVVILLLNPILNRLPAAAFSWLGGLAPTARTVLPKLLATGVTFVWNYLWYGKVIFKDASKQDKELIASETV